MSIAKNARASQVMADISNGKWTSVNKQGKFANYGSVPEDSIYYHTMLAEKADKERKQKYAEMKARLRLKGISV